MKKSLSFEKAMEELEEIVNSMEKGDLTLEEALEAYQKGVVLSQHCAKILEEAEGRIASIMKEDDGNEEINPIKEFKE